MPLIKKLPFLSSQKSGRLVLWVDIPIYQLQFAETQERCFASTLTFKFIFAFLKHWDAPSFVSLISAIPVLGHRIPLLPPRCFFSSSHCPAPPPSHCSFYIRRICTFLPSSPSASASRHVLKDSSTLRCFCSLLWPTPSHSFPQASSTCATMWSVWIR